MRIRDASGGLLGKHAFKAGGIKASGGQGREPASSRFSRREAMRLRMSRRVSSSARDPELAPPPALISGVLVTTRLIPALPRGHGHYGRAIGPVPVIPVVSEKRFILERTRVIL